MEITEMFLTKRNSDGNYNDHSFLIAFRPKPKPGPLRRGNRVSVLDLYQIKGGRLCLYLLLDLDY
jgi:hypothetical protein